MLFRSLRNPDMDKQANLPGAPKDVEDGVVIVKFSAAALPSVEAAAEKFMATKSSEMPTSGISQTDGKYLVDVHILNLLFIIYKVRSI